MRKVRSLFLGVPDAAGADFHALLEEARFASWGAEYSRALELCRRAIAARPAELCTAELADLLEMASRSQEELEAYSARLPELRAAVAANPTDGEARYKLGVALNALGEYEAANFEYRTALVFSESICAECHRDSLNNIGWYHFRRGEYRDALAWFERACDFHVPDDPGPYHLAMENMLLVYARLGMKEPAERLALEYIEHLGRIPPTERRALGQLGIDADALFVRSFLEER